MKPFYITLRTGAITQVDAIHIGYALQEAIKAFGVTAVVKVEEKKVA